MARNRRFQPEEARTVPFRLNLRASVRLLAQVWNPFRAPDRPSAPIISPERYRIFLRPGHLPPAAGASLHVERLGTARLTVRVGGDLVDPRLRLPQQLL